MKLKTILLAALLLTPVVALCDWQLRAWGSLWLLSWLGVPTIGIVALLAAAILLAGVLNYLIPQWTTSYPVWGEGLLFFG